MLANPQSSLKRRLTHPKSIWVFCGIGFFATFSFYIVLTTLILCCTNVYNLSEDDAYLLYHTYTSLIFILPLIGGYLGNRFFGYHNAAIAGLLLATIGLYMLCFHSFTTLYLGLACFCLGCGTAFPNLLILLGCTYKDTPSLTEAGFTLIYIFINAGGFLASCTALPIANEWGFQGSFLLAATAMMLSLMLFVPCSTPFVDVSAFQYIRSIRLTAYRKSHPFIGLAYLLLCIPFLYRLLLHAPLSNHLFLVAGLIVPLLLSYAMFQYSFSERPPLYAFFLLFFFSVCYSALYKFMPTLMTLFIQAHTSQHILHLSVGDFNLLNLSPFFVALLGCGAYLFHKHIRQTTFQQPALPSLFAIGIMLLGFSFLLLDVGVYYTPPSHHMRIGWILLSYLLQAAGELCIVPTGTAMVCKLLNKKHHGFYMGAWLCSFGIGNVLSDYLVNATYYKAESSLFNLSDHFFVNNFTHYTIVTMTLAITLSLIAPKLRQWCR